MPHPGLIRAKKPYFVLVTANKAVTMEFLGRTRIMDERLEACFTINQHLRHQKP
jgi:uncharacterized protein involved in tolerance to divalent cations